MGSPTVLSSPSPPSAPSAFHPPFFRSRRQEMMNPLMAFPLGFSAIFAIHKLGLTLPGETVWRTLSEREQTLWKPVLYVICWSIVTLLTAHPTTSYFYPSSPGFHWTETAPPNPSSTATPNLPTGRWRWSSSGRPSSSGHPLSQRQSLLPFNWPVVVFALPTVFGWLLYVTGTIGEADGSLYLAWQKWLLVATIALFPIIYWWAGKCPDEREPTEKA